jgi:hypothetical protein
VSHTHEQLLPLQTVAISGADVLCKATLVARFIACVLWRVATTGGFDGCRSARREGRGVGRWASVQTGAYEYACLALSWSKIGCRRALAGECART